MPSSVRRLLVVILASYLVGFLFFLLLSALSVPGGRLLDSYRIAWILRAALDALFGRLVPLTAFASMVTFSLLLSFDGGTVPPQPAFLRTVQGGLILTLVLALGFGFLTALAAPANTVAMNSLIETSRLAETFREEAEAAMEVRDFESAVNRFRDYLEIDPGNAEVSERLRVAEGRLEAPDAGPGTDAEAAAAGSATTGQVLRRRGEDFLQRARRALEDDDPYSAFSYADLAETLNPRLTGPQEVQAEARRRIETAAEIDDPREEYFSRKRAAQEDFEDGRYAEAYYELRLLATERPDDPDLERLLPQVERALADEYFFYEDMRPYADAPGRHDIVFRNNPGGVGYEVVGIRKLVQTPTEVYVWGVEVLTLDADGRPVSHYRADYGKSRGDALTFRAVLSEGSDGNMPESADALVAAPVNLMGSEPAPTLLNLAMPPEQLGLIDTLAGNLSTGDLGALLTLREIGADFGYGLESVHAELLRRLVELLSFVSLTLPAMALGWSLRRSEGEPSRFVTYLPLVALPFLWTTFYGLYLDAFVVAGTALVRHAGFIVALVAVAAVHVAIMFASLVSLAGRSPR